MIIFFSSYIPCCFSFSFFFFNDTATTEIYTLSLHDALPIFAEHGINIAAVFDKDPEKVGRPVGHVTVSEYGRLAGIARDKNIIVGVLAVPADAAQTAADDLVAAGVKIIFNYSEALLETPADVTVHTSNPAVELLYALYFHLT